MSTANIALPAGAPGWAVGFARSIETFVHALFRRPQPIPAFTVATVPSAVTWYKSTQSAMIFVTNESGGAVPAFTDGTNWRRVTDRAIIS